MKLLLVDGQEFAASMFEKRYKDMQDAYRDVVANGGHIKMADFDVKLIEFTDFAGLIRDKMFDYDSMKHTNIYIVEN